MNKHVASAGFSGMSLSQLTVFGQENHLGMRGRPPKDIKAAKLLKAWRKAMVDAGYDGTGTLKHKKESHVKHNLAAHESKVVDTLVHNSGQFSLAGPLPKDPVKRKATIEYRAKVKAIRQGGNVSQIIGLDVPLPELTDEEVLGNTKEKFDVMRELIQGVADNGAPRALIVAGGGGVGKSYNVQDILDTYKEQGRNITYESGKVTPIQLYKLLWNFKEEGDIIVLDDTGAIFSNEEAIELLKAALDTKSERWISWRSEAGSLASENVDSKFLYRGSVIFLTNKDMESLKETGPVKLRPHMEALMTRAVYLDLALHTKRQLLLWVNYITRKFNLFIQEGLTKSEQDTALKYIAENCDNMREISLRTVKKLAEFMKSHGGSGQGNWRKFANHTLLLNFHAKTAPSNEVKAAAATSPAGNDASQ